MDKRLYIILAAVLFASCATQAKRNDADLAQLAEWYPGRYTNGAQAQADARSGVKPPHAALEVNIARIYAPRISDFTYYVQESAADDPRRIFTQRLVSFKAVKNRGIVQSLWTFAEPIRWRDAHRNGDLFKGMTSQDLKPMEGCDLVWKKKAEKDAFEASNDQAECRVSSEAAGGMVRLKLRAELNPDELALSEQSFDPSGRLLQDEEADPFYRFLRR